VLRRSCERITLDSPKAERQGHVQIHKIGSEGQHTYLLQWVPPTAESLSCVGSEYRRDAIHRQ
jgi:hypothetical protein